MKKKTRKLLSKIFGILAVILGVIAALLVLAGIVGMFLSEPTFLQGWTKFTDTFSPFNILNYLVIFLFFSPALIFWKLKDWLNTTEDLPKNEHKNISEEVAGEYLFEDVRYTVYVENGMIRAKTQDGKTVQPMEIVFKGRKIQSTKNMDKPKYFELDGTVASIRPTADGGEKVTVPEGMSIADFMQSGSVITEKEFNELRGK